MLFDFDFETGDFSEVITEVYGDGQVEISTDVAHSGTYSVKCTASHDGRARIHKGVYDLRKANARVYVYITKWEGPYQGYIEILEFRENPEPKRFVAWMQIYPGTLRLIQLWGVGQVDASYTFELNKWYCVELEADLSANGHYAAYVNGERLIYVEKDLSDAPTIGNIKTGIILCDTDMTGIELYIDDFAALTW